MKKFSIGFCVVAVGFCSAIGGYYHQKQEELIFKSKYLSRDYVYNWEYPFEELFIPVGERGEINALHFHRDHPKGVVLFLHGQGQNLSYWGKRADLFLKDGYEVVIIDYRGFGKSTGNPSGFRQETLLEDSEVAYQYLQKLYPENQIIIYGQSLGTSFATWVASKHSPKMLILEAPYYNMHEAALHGKPFLPRWAINLILKYDFKTNEWIQDVSSPIFIFHGTDDVIIPYGHSQKLFKEIKGTKFAEIITLENWGHHNIDQNAKYQTKLTEILG